MNEKFKNWTHAVVVFSDGASYTVGNMKFTKRVPKRVTSLAIRKKLEGAKGFHITDYHERMPAPNVPNAPLPAEGKPERKTRKVRRTKKPEGA